MDPLVEFQNITKRFKDEVVLNNVQLQIFPDEIFGIIGRSGSGKTTLTRILLGFYPPDEGKLIYRGEDITTHTNKIRRIVGLTTQENSFYPRLTAKENLMYYGRIYDLKKETLETRVPLLLRLMNLVGHENVLAEDLSGGMKRRLDFAISLIHDPDLLILDEPTTGLDPVLTEDIWDIIWKIHSTGKTVIIISHLFDEIEQNCGRVGILNKGRFLAVQSPGDLRRQNPAEKNLAQIFKKYVEYYDR
ncbi:MAG: ABC transporter ATP-binding protein [Candidatus Woesearchaeota archaeon]